MEKNQSGYSLRLTSIGNGSWQLFLDKMDDSSDFVRIVYGVTEQVGGGKREFKVIRKYIISPGPSKDPTFMYQFEEFMMKNRRVWIAFEAVKRVKNKRGVGTGAFIALSPVQSKWHTTIGSTTALEIKPIDLIHFKELYTSKLVLDQKYTQLIE